jgi:predicted TIM-barrel fold metal-dependent hydrolase
MALTPPQLFSAADAISSNPMDRVPSEMKALIGSDKNVLFDVHTHVFNHLDIPDMFLGLRFDINKPMVDILSLLVGVADFIPFVKLADLGRLLKRLRSSEEKLFEDALNVYKSFAYEPIFNVLMMDMDAIENKNKPDLRSFEDQKKALIKIRDKYPDRILPFIALDPEQNGDLEEDFIEAFTSLNFFGVKIYPSLGYWPSHPRLMNIYKICEEKNIPVTTHCSSGKTRSSTQKINIQGWEMEQGIPIEIEKIKVFNDHKADTYRLFFNGPERWEPVLHHYPNLFLNIAHFGGEHEWKRLTKNGKSDWIDTIERLLKDPNYPNVFSDFSFTFSYKKYNKLLKTWMETKPYIKTQVLNGSDYFLTATERPLKKILKKYIRQLGSDNINQLGSVNAKRFLFEQAESTNSAMPLIA